MNDHRDNMREMHPGAKGSAITQLLGIAWKALSDAERAEYADRAAEKWRQVRPCVRSR